MKTPQYEDRNILMSHIIEGNIINIPTYQRKLVWKKKRQESFLRNVLEGQPFGIILIKEKKEENSDQIKYDLVDGLQRISTLLKFNKDPLEYLKPNDINIEKVEELIRTDYSLKGLEVNEEEISTLKKEIQEKIFDCIKGGFENFDVMSILRKEFELSDKREINSIINEIYSEFMEYINIDNLQIRAINYKGSEENIPNVFYHLNTGGVQLTKYDTYAALWNDTKFKVDDEELIELVVDKYNKLQESSEIEVDFSEDALTEEGITLHEYCYALGNIMINIDEGIPILFSKNKKPTDPTGFELLALLLKNNVNKADKIYTPIKDLHKDTSQKFLVDLKDIIKDSLVEISTTLRPFLVGMNQTSLNSGSDYQIYHMIASYIKEYYDINIDTGKIEKRDSPLNKKDFEDYAPLHYFYDCITDFWNINRQVTDLNREIEDENRRQRYWSKIPYPKWKKAMETFMESQDSSRKLIWQKNKLFIDFLTKLKIKENSEYIQFFSKNDLADKKFTLDIEHITPKKVIGNHIKDLPQSQQKAYSVSPVGNLCYLTVKDNRSKRHETLYENNEGRPSFVLNEDYLNCIIYPSKDELEFTKFNNEEFRESYKKFIKERQEKLREEFLRLIKNY